jgi:hypothetical protein
MVEPLSALACLPLSHSENFLKVTDELPVEVWTHRSTFRLSCEKEESAK